MALNRFKFSSPRRVALCLLALYVGLSLLGGVGVSWYDHYRLQQEKSQHAGLALHMLVEGLDRIDQDIRISATLVGLKDPTSQAILPESVRGAVLLDQDGRRTWVRGAYDASLDMVKERKGWARLYERSAVKAHYAPMLAANGPEQPALLPVLVPLDVGGRLILFLSPDSLVQWVTEASPAYGLSVGVESADMYPVIWSDSAETRDHAQISLLGGHLRSLLVSGTTIQTNVMDDGAVMAFAPRQDTDLLLWSRVSNKAEHMQWWGRSLSVMVVLCMGQALLILIVYILFNEMHLDRQKNDRLQELNRNLARSNADLEQFAYIASHDLKEPLRNISGYVQLLQRRYEGRLDDDADTFIRYTVDGVQRLQVIINELLAYSRIGTGQLQRNPVQIGVLVGNALGLLKGAISEAMASVEVKGTLPLVPVDAAQITSLLQNLISNAIKYRMPDIRPEIQIGYVDKGDEWAFFVRDNGIGIDQQYHQQIFGLFKRLHSRDQYAGTGIGLAVCQRIIERHGGHIWVESRLGEGTCFWFTLPKSVQ